MKEAHVKMRDLVPSEWVSEAITHALMTCCTVLASQADLISDKVTTFRIGDVVAILNWGRSNYYSVEGDPHHMNANGQWEISGVPLVKDLPESAYLFLIAPVRPDDEGQAESSARNKTAVAQGLLVALFGQGIAYERVYENEIEIATGIQSVSTPWLRNPASLPKPSFSKVPEITEYVAGRIEEADPSLKAKIELALRWFERVAYEAGVDAFLGIWIAIETLCMPDTTNIRPINELLAKTYAVEYETARDSFFVGRLYGLRSKIVHDGVREPLNAAVLDYTRAVFVDLLLTTLEVPGQRRARAELDRDANLENLLKSMPT